MQHEASQLIDMLFTKTATKSDPQTSNLIRTLFQSPNMMLSHLNSIASNDTRSGIDLKKLFKIYEVIGHSNKDSQLLVLFNKAFNELITEQAFKAFLTSSRQLKYFFVVILWDKLFKNKNYEFVTIRGLEYIEKAPQYRQLIINWFEDVPGECIRTMLVGLHNMLEMYCNKLVEKEQTEAGNKDIGKKCQTICNFMEILHTSNKNKPRVALKEFNNAFLTNFFQPVEQIKIYINKDQYFNFIKYSFLLNFEYKYKLIQIESVYEQKMNIKKNMERGLAALIQDFDFQSGNFGIEGLLYLCISVRRNFILDDSMEKLGKVKQNLRSPLKIQFIGEQGADQGGVKNEYFSLLTKQIFNPYLDMFIPKSSGRFYWFNGYSYEMPVRFEFVGMLLGLALYNGVHLDIHFPEITFKKLLNKRYQQEYGLQIVQDLKQIEPQIYRSLKTILEATESLDDLELYFNIQLESFGQTIVEELVQDGNMIKLTIDNREEYCLLYADYLLNKHIAKQFAPFRKGFYRVVSGGIVESFEAEELSILINGKEQINIKELEESATYEGGYTRETPVIRYLWEFLHKLNDDDKKNFLTFVTGTDRVPIDGLKSLKFNIQRHSNTNNLPTAHTCFNVLLLPEYETQAQLEKNMKLILEHNQGFGLI